MLHEVNLNLSFELNEAVYKMDYLTLDAEKFNQVPRVRSSYDAKNALVLVDSGSCLKSISSQVVEGSLFVTPIVSTSSKTRLISTCHHCGEFGHIRPSCRKVDQFGHKGRMA